MPAIPPVPAPKLPPVTVGPKGPPWLLIALVVAVVVLIGVVVVLLLKK